jgi:flagellar biosynthesis protein FliQ
MTPGDALDLLQVAVWTVFVASAPAVLAAMAIGTLIALLQALTQIQEVTLTFVPKIIAVMLALSVSSVFMGSTMLKFTELSYARISEPVR